MELAAHYLIVSTKKAIYIAELEYTHLFEAKNVGLITKTDSFAVGVDHSQVLVLSDDLKLFSITSIREASRLFSKTVINPLDNPGLCCSGGYSNINGCHTACDLKQTNNYS